MKRVLLLATCAAAIATAVGVSSVRAAPIPGGFKFSVPEAPDSLSLNVPPSLGCPFVLKDYGGNPTGTVTATINGWLGPIDQDTFLEQVDLRAHLTGTVQDAAGNTYSVNGNFTEKRTIDTLTTFDVRFDGTGKLRLIGPAGSLVGTAEFFFVTGPPSFELTFSSIKRCTI